MLVVTAVNWNYETGVYIFFVGSSVGVHEGGMHPTSGCWDRF